MRGWLMLAVLALAVSGCKKDEAAMPASGAKAEGAKAGEAAKAGEGEKAAAPTKAAEPVKPAGHAIWGTYDLAAELGKLAGKWKVKSSFGQKEPDTWQVEGDKVTITTAGGETKLGKLMMPMPGSLAVKEGDMTSYYGYARDGETLYIGLGTGGVKVGDSYFVGASRGVVAFDGTKCAYHAKKMGFGDGPVEFEAPVDVQCSVQAAADKGVLHYQVPRFMKEGEFDDKQIAIVGEALINDQLQSDHKVEKAE
ncbi:MAG: hypothetical protein KC620_06635 [Myxococcales bacterium]|nr:hypothetical protein [Myxococcales bacterium]